MEIKIHRGLEQIGGCITEISTATSRVFIDLGQNLPGNGEELTPEQDKLMVENLFNSNKKDYEAVFYTHGHEDHIGLFEYVPMDVPQFMSAGTKELILIKYRTLQEGNDLHLGVGGDGGIQQNTDGIGGRNDAVYGHNGVRPFSEYWQNSPPSL